MIYANVFGKIAGVIFYVCVGVSICLLTYGGVRRLIELIKAKKRIKQDKEKLEKKKNEPKRTEKVDKD